MYYHIRTANILVALALVFAAYFIPAKASSSNQVISVTNSPWVQSLTPVRQFYVSKKGQGSGGNVSDPMSLSTAISIALPGDEFSLTKGKYKGRFTLLRSGTATNPIVFRSMPGGQEFSVFLVLAKN